MTTNTPRPYHTLLVRDEAGIWDRHFGDYSKKAVREELEWDSDIEDVRKADCKIVTTEDSEAAIQEKVDLVNLDLPFSKHEIGKGWDGRFYVTRRVRIETADGDMFRHSFTTWQTLAIARSYLNDLAREHAIAARAALARSPGTHVGGIAAASSEAV